MYTGSLCYLPVQLTRRNSKLTLDACPAIFLSGIFGLGMVLKSIIQGNPRFQQAAQSGLENYIFEQAAYMMIADVRLILAVSLYTLLLFAAFYAEISRKYGF
ncbi:MAG: hypothetical protein GX907_05665 [Clostridiaceae bacterium]|nr:hypothetical protein [Clostridiaceae bacterium]